MAAGSEALRKHETGSYGEMKRESPAEAKSWLAKRRNISHVWQ